MRKYSKSFFPFKVKVFIKESFFLEGYNQWESGVWDKEGEAGIDGEPQ